MKDVVVVIGAGVAGIGAALELAEQGHKVLLLERKELGYGSSGRNAARMGHGFHYADEVTALNILGASIQIQRKYPGFLLKGDQPNSPIEHGRYFIAVGSDPGKEKILSVWYKIQEEYARLVKLDKANQVFGPPETFFRILDPKEYEHQVNSAEIELGIETNEHLFQWDRFATFIREKLKTHPNIEFREHTEVLKIRRNNAGRLRFIVELKSANKDSETLYTHHIINSTWENIEALNQGLGIRFDPESRTNRTKAILVVELPKELENSNSIFIGMGPFGMMVNMGGGRAMVTYAQATNIETSSGLTITENTQRLLHRGPSATELTNWGDTMLTGLKRFIPAIVKARVVELKCGVVRTEGVLKLNQLADPNHSYNRRTEHGVTAVQTGLVNNAAMKLFFFLKNGILVADHIKQFNQADKFIDEVIEILHQLLTNQKLELADTQERSAREKLEQGDMKKLLASSAMDMAQQLLEALKTQKALTHYSLVGGMSTQKTDTVMSTLNRAECNPKTLM